MYIYNGQQEVTFSPLHLYCEPVHLAGRPVKPAPAAAAAPSLCGLDSSATLHSQERTEAKKPKDDETFSFFGIYAKLTTIVLFDFIDAVCLTPQRACKENRTFNLHHVPQLFVQQLKPSLQVLLLQSAKQKNKHKHTSIHTFHSECTRVCKPLQSE